MRVYDLKRVDAADALDDACFDLAHAESAAQDAHKVIARLEGCLEEARQWLEMYSDFGEGEKPAPKPPREGDLVATDLIPSADIPFINTKEVRDDQV